MSRQLDVTPSSPFRPGYGKMPLVFGGHHGVISELTRVFSTYDFGENQSVLLSGLRGAGKTSMLTLLRDAALEEGWSVISDDASTGLMDRVMQTSIPRLVNEVDDASKARIKALGVWQFNAQWEYVDRSRDVKPLLRNDLIALSEALDNRGILVTIDEVSSGRVRLRELSRFALEIAHALSEGVNLMVVFAGIKIDLDELLKQDHTTFVRRSRDVTFARLGPDETMDVLRRTIEIGGRSISDDAVRRLAQISQGYPYLIQFVGDYAWRARQTSTSIDLPDAEVALDKAIKAVMSRVISRVYLDLSEKDRAFVKAMTHATEDGRAKMSSIVRAMGESDQYVQVYRRRLMDSGYVQPAGHGYVSFSLPYLDQYIRTIAGDDLGAESGQDDAWAILRPPEI